MKKTTRDKIIEAGARIIHRKGYNHTGIQEVLTAAGVPKGSFYFYFKNKEDFGLRIIDYFNAFYAEKADAVLKDRSIPPLERIKQFLAGFKDLLKSMEYTCGCPIGNLAQEMGDLSPEFREKLKKSVDIMADFYIQVLDEAKHSGDIPRHLDTREIADFIVSSWHGALIRMKIERSPLPLENHSRMILEMILHP